MLLRVTSLGMDRCLSAVDRPRATSQSANLLQVMSVTEAKTVRLDFEPGICAQQHRLCRKANILSAAALLKEALALWRLAQLHNEHNTGRDRSSEPKTRATCLESPVVQNAPTPAPLHFFPLMCNPPSPELSLAATCPTFDDEITASSCLYVQRT